MNRVKIKHSLRLSVTESFLDSLKTNQISLVHFFLSLNSAPQKFKLKFENLSRVLTDLKRLMNEVLAFFIAPP